jgi:hypothetical protein
MALGGGPLPTGHPQWPNQKKKKKIIWPLGVAEPPLLGLEVTSATQWLRVGRTATLDPDLGWLGGHPMAWGGCADGCALPQKTTRSLSLSLLARSLSLTLSLSRISLPLSLRGVADATSRGQRRQSEVATLASSVGKWWFKCL